MRIDPILRAKRGGRYIEMDASSGKSGVRSGRWRFETEEEQGMKEAGEWTRDCGLVPMDFQGLAGSPGIFQGFPTWDDTDQGNGNMENEIGGVGARGERVGRGQA